MKKGDIVFYLFDQEIDKNGKSRVAKRGVVSSFNKNGVWVKFDTPDIKMVTGDEDITAQKCDYRSLFKGAENNE